MVVLVIPGEEVAAEGLGILDAAEAFWELRLIFERLEVAFREGIVVRSIWPTVRFGDAQISKHERGGLSLHGWAAIGVEGELARGDPMFGDAVFEQWLEQSGAFGVSDMPPDNTPAKYINNYI